MTTPQDAHDATTGSTQHLRRPGGRLGYDVTGSGPLVVCMPGMGDLRSTSYRHLAPALVAAGYRVATVDLRGHGDSDPTFESYDDVAAGSDLVALVDELGGPAVLVGSSMAAGAAVLAAAERPEAVRGLVLLGPFVRNPPTNPLLMALFRLALMRPWGRMAWKSYFPKYFPGRRPADLDEQLSAIDAGLRRPGYWAAFHATTRTTHAPAEAALPRVGAPTLVVMGTADPDFPDASTEGRWVAEQLSADLTLVPDAGHYPHVEYPEVTTPAVLAFLARVAPRA